MKNKSVKWLFPLLATLLLTSYSATYATDTAQHCSKAGYVASAPNQQEYASDELPAASNDSSFPEQWALSTIMAPEAWQITSGEPNVFVAILDTGIDQNHEDLTGKVVASINFTQSPTADDLYGHGTHIAGTIAASADNAVGITGAAYDCSLMNVKVAEDDGTCTSGTVARGIIWAVDNGAKVINISLTFTEPSLILENAVNYAWDKGAVIVAAAGNSFSSTPVYPAAYSKAIAVAATDKGDHSPSWSNHGDWVSLSAPGINIYSTLPNDSYGYKSGTSSAAALVSGEAVLLSMIATDTNGNGYINDEIRQGIENNCDEAEMNGLGKGRINILKAAKAVLNR